MTTNRSNDASAKPRPFHRMVRRPDTLSDEVRREALSLFERGAGDKTVAHALDINVHTARDWGRLFRKGRFSPTLLYQGFIYNETVREEVRTLRNQGLSLREISRITGVSAATCRNWTTPEKKAGKKHRHQKPNPEEIEMGKVSLHRGVRQKCL